MLPVLVLLGGLLWLLRQPTTAYIRLSAANSRSGGRRLPVVLALGTFIFLTRYPLLFDASSEFLRTPFQDYVFYARLTTPLTLRGVETNSLEVLYPQFLAPYPYHYLEIWWNALLVQLTGLPSVWCMFLCAFSVMITIVGVGFAAIFAHFGLPSRWLLVLAVLFLTVTGVVWPFLQHISLVQNGALLSSLLLPLQPKLAPVYWFMLLGTALLLSRQYVAAAVALAIVAVVFVAAAPVVGAGVVVVALYLWRTQQLRLKESMAMVAPVVLAGACIVLFYGLQPAAYTLPGTGEHALLQAVMPRLAEARTLINIGLGVLLNFGVYFLGYGLVVVAVLLASQRVVAIGKQYQVVLVWFAASLLAAAVMRTLAHHFLDGFQFFSNPMVPLTAIVLAVFLGAGLQNARRRTYVLSVVALLGLLLVNSYKLLTDSHDGHVTTRYSPKFLRQMKQVMPTLGSRGGYILADAEYSSAYTLSSDSYTAGNYVSNFKNDYALLSLSALDADSLTTDPRFVRDSTQAEQITRQSTLYRFAKFQSLRHRSTSLDSAKYELVREAGLSFICASRRAQLPIILRPLVIKTYVDSYSGEKLYVLRGRQFPQPTDPYQPRSW
ncbi:hypothetical protein J0X19_05475 [Hymenobacter sp. BT186]|uniref:Uncharacterized protein n=1 Tax=Hymenobacter telluris TaxID=2816474 RepID=A0A939JCK6_9BACT|nr:hypothetical protein [Hymenobacter telluris]MBO0357387.1 hypothetical protein [Hymenobacter telluris]MBW3373413.1 hypothetical protein [Hymenobacter norwichensis]